jgi:hypothetical protein
MRPASAVRCSAWAQMARNRSFPQPWDAIYGESGSCDASFFPAGAGLRRLMRELVKLLVATALGSLHSLTVDGSPPALPGYPLGKMDREAPQVAVRVHSPKTPQPVVFFPMQMPTSSERSTGSDVLLPAIDAALSGKRFVCDTQPRQFGLRCQERGTPAIAADQESRKYKNPNLICILEATRKVNIHLGRKLRPVA